MKKSVFCKFQVPNLKYVLITSPFVIYLFFVSTYSREKISNIFQLKIRQINLILFIHQLLHFHLYLCHATSHALLKSNFNNQNICTDPSPHSKTTHISSPTAPQTAFQNKVPLKRTPFRKVWIFNNGLSRP